MLQKNGGESRKVAEEFALDGMSTVERRCREGVRNSKYTRVACSAAFQGKIRIALAAVLTQHYTVNLLN